MKKELEVHLEPARLGAKSAIGECEPTEAQVDLIRDLMFGWRCQECAEPVGLGESCECCAEKQEILRQVFPSLYGDA